jgi:hypothetical protein
MDLEIGRSEAEQWRALGSFTGRVSRSALHRWAEECGAGPGTYEVREPGGDEPRYLFRVESDGGVATVETLDLD